MAKTFRGSSSPGRYGLLDPNLAFGETKRLVSDNQRAKAERDKNRAALADRNRTRQNSLIASFGPANQSRQLALKDEAKLRGVSTQMHEQRIAEARITADRNATNQANQNIKARQEIVTLIKDVGGTAIDAYETFDRIKVAEDRKELFKIGAKYGTNTETLVGIRALNLDLIGEGQDDHEKHQALLAAGWTPLDIVKVNKSREAAFYAEKVNALRRDVQNIPNLLATDLDYQKAIKAAAEQGDEPAFNVLYNDKIAGLATIGAGLNPNDLNTQQFYEQLRNAKAAALSKFRAEATIHAQSRLAAENVGLTQAGMDQFPNNAPAWASWVRQQASDKENPVGFINEQFGNIEILAKGADAGELTRLRSYYDSLANTIPKNGKLTYDQDPRFSKAAEAARKAIYDAGNQDLKDTVLAQKTEANKVRDRIKQVIDSDLSFEEITKELEATKIATAGEPYAAQIAGEIDHYIELHTPETADEARFYQDLKMPGYVTQDMIDRGEYGSDAKSQYKLSKVLAEAERKDKGWQKQLNKVESDLKKAVGVNLTTSILPGSYYEALDDATEQLQKVRQDTLLRTNGDQKAADQAMNDWWVKFGPNKDNYYEGRYAIWDRAKHAHKDGFSNPSFHGLQGEPSGKTIKTYTDIKDVFTKNSLDTYDSRYTEVTSNSNISKQLITDEQLKAWTANPHLNVGISNLLKNIDRQTGSRGIPKLAEDIARSRNMDIPQTPQQALHERAAEISNELRLKFGSVNADRFNNNTLTRRGEGGSIRYDYIREDAQTAGYNLAPTGSDYTHALFPGKVIQIRHQFNQNAIGGDGRPGAGWGHHVIIRHTNPRTGEEYDMVYAHFPKDSIQVRVGQTVTQGQILGPMATDDQFTNDRPNVGSGRGVHMSVDMFEKNSNTPYRNWRQVGELIRGLGRETSQPQQQQTAPTVQPTTEIKAALADGEYRNIPGYDDIKLTNWEGRTWMAIKKPNGEWIRIPANLENREKLRELDRNRWKAVTWELEAMNDA